MKNLKIFFIAELTLMFWIHTNSGTDNLDILK